MQPYVQARRAAKAGVEAHHFEAAEIFERDSLTCWLCGGIATQDAPKNHPMRATLDHVIPLARGGVHSRENVRCAHLRCNLKKGVRLVGEPPTDAH